MHYLFKTLPVLKGDEAKVAINLLFDDFFELIPLEMQRLRPLATVALSEDEEYGRQSPLYAAIEQYAKSGVPEIFPGLSIEKFLELPTEITRYMLEIAERRRNEKLALENNAASAADAQLRALGMKK